MLPSIDNSLTPRRKSTKKKSKAKLSLKMKEHLLSGIDVDKVDDKSESSFNLPGSK